MTRYTVVWNDDALQELAQIWLTSANRRLITQAVSFIDSSLARSAESKGEHVLHGIRDLPMYPLRVLFTANESDRLVRVVHVSLILK